MSKRDPKGKLPVPYKPRGICAIPPGMGFVYFALHEGYGHRFAGLIPPSGPLIKVGVSMDPIRRVRQQSGLKMLAYVPGEPALEAQILRALDTDGYRPMRGMFEKPYNERFHPTPRVMRFVNAAKVGPGALIECLLDEIAA